MKRMKQEMELNIKMRSIHQKLFAIFLLFCLLASLTGCFSHTDNVPGAREYAINFEIDYDIFDSGKYHYKPLNTFPDGNRMGGGRLGGGYFDVLIMDFKFKDGRAYHEEIDMRPLVEEMREKYKLPPQMLPMWHQHRLPGRQISLLVGWSIFSNVNVKITRNKLLIDYQLTETVLVPVPPEIGPGFKYQTKNYPLFEKDLN